jgi:hypothetical protein
LGLPEEERKPFFLKEINTVHAISKRLSEFQRKKYIPMIEENIIVGKYTNHR